MQSCRPGFLWLAAGAALLTLAPGCRGLPQGPSLSNIAVSSLRLEPTLDDPALCCCRVVGSVRNENRVPVHATFKFSAFDGERTNAISSILFFVPDLQPGAERPIDAHGFVFPCTVIKELKTELDIKGIAFPPL